jgi:hypothetical protein
LDLGGRARLGVCARAHVCADSTVVVVDDDVDTGIIGTPVDSAINRARRSELQSRRLAIAAIESADT